MDRIGDEIQRELARGGSRDAVPLAAVTAAWPAAVGDAVARRAWPLRISRDGTLHVAVESATWAQELTLLESDVLGALRAQLADATPVKLRFAVGPIPEQSAQLEQVGSVAVEPPEVPPEVEAEALSAAAAIDDPELRELVARAARTSLLRARSGRHF
jgi:Dna[CI] antecedent, DciA